MREGLRARNETGLGATPGLCAAERMMRRGGVDPRAIARIHDTNAHDVPPSRESLVPLCDDRETLTALAAALNHRLVRRLTVQRSVIEL